MIVRDEADVIPETLAHLCTWADEIVILDTGSVDGTREIIDQWQRDESRIRVLEHDPIFYSNAARKIIFDAARSRMRRGDWFVRADADEFYPVSPPEFVARWCRGCDGQVFKHAFDSTLTEAEFERWRSDPASSPLEAASVRERGLKFAENDYLEPRMNRYRPSMRWHAGEFAPRRGGVPCERRLTIEHFRYRHPMQLARRLLLRRLNYEHHASHGRRVASLYEKTRLSEVLVDTKETELVDRETVAIRAADPLPIRTHRLSRIGRYRAGARIYPVVASVLDRMERSTRTAAPEPISDAVQTRIRDAYRDIERNGLNHLI